MIFDPTTGNPTTGAGRQAFQTNGILNAIPQNRLSSQALNILKFLPGPNAPGNRPASPTTTGAANTSTAPASATPSKPNPWYPDHAVINATKDELKAMPEFKYST